MRWTRKAQIQRSIARVPLIGNPLYVAAQRRFGALTVDISSRLPRHVELLELARAAGVTATGARTIEVGSGHHPVLPLLFSLCGAAEVLTVDLNRRLQWRDTAELMEQLVARSSDLHRTYVESGLVEADVMIEGLTRLSRYAGQPREYFAAAGIRYVAPGDAATLDDVQDETFDIHFSTNVLEHIPREVLGAIFEESARVLRPGGLALHLVDPSDHFAQSDSSIPLINFLRYSQPEWDRIAGNRFAYHNRIRGLEFAAILKGAGFRVEQEHLEVDSRSLQELKDGFPVHPDFARFSPEDLAVSFVQLAGRKEDSGA